MTFILFWKLVYFISLIGMIYPNIKYHKQLGYLSIEGVFYTLLTVFIPILNTILFFLFLINTIKISKILEYKIWGKEMTFKPSKEELLRDAFSKVFSLGENHWMYADSEYPSQWKNADIVIQKYNEFVDEIIKEILDDQNS